MEIPTSSPLHDEPIIQLDNEVQVNNKKPSSSFVDDEDDIPEMSFSEKSEGGNLVDDGKITLKESSKTSSKWVSTIVFKVLPEATHHVIKIDESKIRKKAERAGAPVEYKELLKEIEETNDRHKEALQVDEDFREMFDEGLRDWFIDKGAEVQISPIWRVIGAGILILVMFAIQVFGIHRENQRIERKIEDMDKKLTKQNKPQAAENDE